MQKNKGSTPKRPEWATAEEWEAAEILELTEADFANMRPAQEGLGQLVGEETATRLLRRRGRPPMSRPKRATSIRFSAEVLDYFRATGPGWQTRMDEILKEWVIRQST